MKSRGKMAALLRGARWRKARSWAAKNYSDGKGMRGEVHTVTIP